ncbi:MAG: molecular chaperone TorD family protein [Acidobacteria bacterium]|nr:molecular chaperone TorD family protein [Acidobacteriota bacterium]
MAQDTLNPYATFRFALGYPDERHLEMFRGLSDETPQTLEELRSLYLELFEAGLPHPKCPLLESHYVLNRPATEVVLENKLFYKHFGLQVESKAAPDHLLTQLEFLSWLEHCVAAGNPDRESLEKAKRDFLERHVSHWIPRAAALVRQAGGGCYQDLFDTLEESHAIHACI